jgi:hypothetical protein
MKTKYLSVKSLFMGCMLFAHMTLAETSNDQDTREAILSYEVASNETLKVDASSIDLQFETWNKNEVQIVAKAIYKGDPNERMRQFLDDFERKVEHHIFRSTGKLEISTDLDVPNKVQIGGKVIGVQIDYGRNELEIQYQIKLPATLNLEIKDSYRDLRMAGQYTGIVSIEHYSGDFYADDFNQLDLKLKYGNARFNNVNTGEFELYEQELIANKLRDVKIEAKYSQLEIGRSGQLDLEAYESEFDLNFCDEITGEMKYSTILSENDISTINLRSTYESNFELNEVFMLKIGESKYSEMEMGTIDKLTLDQSYEDKIEIDELGTANINSKYLNLEMNLLLQSLNINGYETDLEIEGISRDFEGILIDGKYANIDIESNEVPINIDANVTYGNISFDQSAFDRKIYIKESSKLEMVLKSKKGTDQSPVIKLRGYEVEATIN